MTKHRAEAEEALPAQPVIVVGSYHWDNLSAVGEVLRAAGEKYDDHIVLITSGCPSGAEWYAERVAERYGWPAHHLRDEEQVNVENALVFAFIRDGSSGASGQLERLSRRFWTKVMRDDDIPQLTGWEGR